MPGARKEQQQRFCARSALLFIFCFAVGPALVHVSGGNLTASACVAAYLGGDNVPIPDDSNTGVVLTAAMACPLELVTRVSVSVNLTHPYLGDLTVVLTSPAGINVTLCVHGQSGNQHLNGTYTFADAPAGLPRLPARGVNAVSSSLEPGSYKPDGSLSVSALRRSPGGTWRLWVRDLGHEDAGVIHSFSVHVSGVPSTGAAAELGAPGAQPWGAAPDVFAGTSARWIGIQGLDLAAGGGPPPDLVLTFAKALPARAVGDSDLTVAGGGFCEVLLDGALVGSTLNGRDLGAAARGNGSGASPLRLRLSGSEVLALACRHVEGPAGVLALLTSSANASDALAWTDGSWSFEARALNNAAMGRRAFASSAHNSSLLAPRAVDGDASRGSLFRSSSADASDVTPWLSVDLGGAVAVERVVLFNRADCCGSNLMNSELRVGWTAIRSPADTPRITANPLVWRLWGRSRDGEVLVAPVFPPRTGAWLTLQNFQTPVVLRGSGTEREATWVLNLYELEVYGEPVSEGPGLAPPPPSPPTSSRPPAAPTARVPSPAEMVAPLPWTHRCSFVLRPALSTIACAAAAAASPPLINGTTGDSGSSGGSTSHSSTDDGGSSGTDGLRMALGAALLQHLGAAGAGFAARAPTDANDWGLTVNGASHLLIEDSVIMGLNLSTSAALLHVTNCSYVTVRNLTVVGLNGLPAGTNETSGQRTAPPAHVYGAVRVAGARGVSLSGSHCSGVKDSHGWACFWLQLASAPTPSTPADGASAATLAPWVRMQDSSCVDNNVVWGGPDGTSLQTCWSREGSIELDSQTHYTEYGMGAIVVELMTDGGGALASSPLAVQQRVFGGGESYATGGSEAQLDGIGSGGSTLLGIAVETSTLSGNAGGCGAALAVPYGRVELTWSGSHALGNTAALAGGALLFSQGLSRGTIQAGSRLAGNAASAGGALACPGGGGIRDLELTGDSSVVENKATYDGGAILAYSGDITNLTITANSTLASNSAGSFGGAIFTYRGGIQGLTINTSSALRNNTAGVYGGAIYAQAGAVSGVTVDGGSSVQGNAAIRGGAVYTASQDLADVRVLNNSTVSGNGALEHGGAFCAWFGAVRGLTLSGGARMSANGAGGSGGVVCNQYGGVYGIAVRAGSSVSANEAGVSGGFVFSGYGGIADVEITGRSNVTSCLAKLDGGALCAGFGPSDADISRSVDGNSTDVAATSSADDALGFRGAGGISNVRLSGGSSLSSNVALARGGAICSWAHITDMVLDGGSDMSSNGAGNGGALFAGYGDVSFSLLNGSRVSTNSAGDCGGAMYILSGNLAVLLASASLESNSARGAGGAIFVADGNITSLALTRNSALSYNRADYYGGGICIESGAVANLMVTDASTVAANVAVRQDGGLLYHLQYRYTDAASIACHVTGASVLTGNTAKGVGGVLASGGLNTTIALTLEQGSSARQNGVAGSGGGVVGAEHANVVLTVRDGSRLDSNAASMGAGGAAYTRLGSITALVEGNSSLSYNKAGYNGGALSAARVDLTVDTNSSVSWNEAEMHGGAVDAPLASIRVLNASSVIANHAGRWGGFLHARGVELLQVAHGSSVDANSADSGGAVFADEEGFQLPSTDDVEASTGGGASASSSSGSNSAPADRLVGFRLVDVSARSSISGNMARLDGGALYGMISDLYVTDRSSMSYNTAASSGGAMYSKHVARLTLSGNSTLAENAASSDYGGAIYVLDCLDAVQTMTWNLTGGSLRRNFAMDSGGAIALFGPNCTLELTGGVYSANAAGAASADGTGGALSVLGGASLVAASLVVGPGNSAGVGGASYVGWGSTLRLANSTLTGNWASQRGGSVAGEDCARLLLSGTLVKDSTCYGNGGAVSVYGCAAVQLVDTQLVNNTASRGGAFAVGRSASPVLAAQLLAGASDLETEDANPSGLSFVAISGSSALMNNTAAYVQPRDASASTAFLGHGGGLYVAHVPGLVMVVYGSVSSSGNNAWLGANLASQQTCHDVPPTCVTALLVQAHSAVLSSAGATGGPDSGSGLLGSRALEFSVPDACNQAPGLADCSLLVTSEPPKAPAGSLGRATPASGSASAGAAGSTLELPPAQARPAWFSDLNLMALYLVPSGGGAASSDGFAVAPAPRDSAWVERPVNRARLQCPTGVDNCTLAALRSGDIIDASVTLFDAFWQPISSVPRSVQYSVTVYVAGITGPNLTVLPLPVPAVPWVLLANQPWPWTMGVGVQGSARFHGLVTGWPSRYTLRMELREGAMSSAPIYTSLSQFVLRGCQLGESLELSALHPDEEVPLLQDEDVFMASCGKCPAQMVGLYPDPRVESFTVVAGDRERFAAFAAAAPLDAVRSWGDTASRTCLSCPDNAVCPGGRDLSPLEGYWHSSPKSPLMQMCRYLKACSRLPDLTGDALAWWESQPGVTTRAELNTRLKDVMSPLEDRALRLAALRRRYFVLAGNTSAATGAAAAAYQDYMTNQCAKGYAGNLCGTCSPGYTLNSFFWCLECPPLVRTLLIGLLAFGASVAIIILGAIENLSSGENSGKQGEGEGGGQDAPPSGPEAGDVLKLLVVHVQYFIIITRLNIPKPPVMTPLTTALTALTGAESLWSYSHACLVSGQDSSGQAYLNVLGALLTPCAVVAVCLLLWALRYALFNAAKLRRHRNTRRHDLDPEWLDNLAHVDSIDAPGANVVRERSCSLSPSQHMGLRQNVGLQTPPTPPTSFVVEGSALSTSASGGKGGPASPRWAPRIKSISSIRRTIRDNTALSGLRHVDQTLKLPLQLWIITIIGVFVLFPSWASAAFSVFSCYIIDDVSGGGDLQGLEFAVKNYTRGYWSRNMNQECYKGDHMWLYVPLGAVFIAIFCVGPPLYNLVMLWRVRHRLSEHHTQQVYGFMYSRYKPRYFWWDTVLMTETLILVAVDVFGGDLTVAYQALMLQLVLLTIAGVNVVLEPMQSSPLRQLEFASTAVLIGTISLNMYFVVGSADLLNDAGGDAVAIVTLVINLLLILAFVAVAVRSWGRKSLRQRLRDWRRRLAGCWTRCRRGTGGSIAADEDQPSAPRRPQALAASGADGAEPALSSSTVAVRVEEV
ncbi:hypothetical protein HYH03_010188 [Edaphochlamys debaryana]|uniref:P/Homo B domain-containing protein n=1 Tax=Edaphochlamys debaryana TaxID=47281 RepID=A0A836BWW2_9CHLO|nr:hypothetical protein HYH03_010188 [Edaphochlamys debaryana]|eukprot:KAG2491397.1 hypothetical protein HYH03_010188 [Edaphochlamys debaryana]